MIFNIEKVFERDIDLLMINKFINNQEVVNYFLKKVNCLGYKTVSVEHSLFNNVYGESDITVILENNNHRIGLLIEDKIDAIAMPEQSDRYDKRGKLGIENKSYDEYYVFIIAPQKYLDTNFEAQKYNYKISYEELQEIMKDDFYASTLLHDAIVEKEKGYTVIEDEAVTLFWKKYYEFVMKNYPRIKIHEVKGPRGSNARWPDLLTDYKEVRIMHKSDRGYLDLTFDRLNGHIDILNKYIEILPDGLPDGCKIVPTGKSLAIRMIVDPMDFSCNFEEYKKEMHDCMKKATVMYNEIVDKLNIPLMYEELKKINR